MKKIAVVIVLFCVAPFALTCTAGAAGFLYGLATHKPKKKPELVIKYVNLTTEERAAREARKKQSARPTPRQEADLYATPELACEAEGAESQDASARDRSFPATPAF